MEYFASTDITRAVILYSENKGIDARDILKDTGLERDFFFEKKHSFYPLHIDGIINRNTKKLFKDEDIGVEIGKNLYHLGVVSESLLTIAKFLGSPKFVYKQVVNQSKKFNNYINYNLKEINHSFARIETELVDYKLTTFTDCAYEEGIYKAVPTIWGLPEANVKQTRCIKNGDDTCEYVISWNNIKSIFNFFNGVKSEIGYLSKGDLEDKINLLINFDEYETGSHFRRVSKITGKLYEECSKFDSNLRDRKIIENATVFHDLGKLDVDYNILKKEGKLTSEEFFEIKNHTIYGSRYFYKNTKFSKYARDICLNHHEKWDGTGYPNQKIAKDIPFSARLVAVADVYDALRCQRSYKKAWDINSVLDFIYSQKGKSFDPKIVDSFFRIKDKFNKYYE